MKLEDLNPTDGGAYFLITCPSCGRHEAFVYKDDIEKAKVDLYSKDEINNVMIYSSDNCLENDIPFFFKQWGGVNKKITGSLLQGREWKEESFCVPRGQDVATATSSRSCQGSRGRR